MSEPIIIKKEEAWDNDPEDVVPPKKKEEVPTPPLQIADKKSIYEKVTISQTEIETLKNKADVVIPEEQKVVYHNKMVRLIEGRIRKAAQNKEKRLCLVNELELQKNECWKRIILGGIVNKMKGNKINIWLHESVGSASVQADL